MVIIIYDNHRFGVAMFEVDWYVGPNGKAPVKDFLDGLGKKARAKVLGRIELLERYGPQLGMPYSRYLDDGIFELRVSQDGEALRVLYFFVVGEKVVLTSGFTKKSQKTPRREIERAKRMRADWEAQHGRV